MNVTTTICTAVHIHCAAVPLITTQCPCQPGCVSTRLQCFFHSFYLSSFSLAPAECRSVRQVGGASSCNHMPNTKPSSPIGHAPSALPCDWLVVVTGWCGERADGAAVEQKLHLHNGLCVYIKQRT